MFTNHNPSGTIMSEYFMHWWISKSNVKTSMFPTEPEIGLFNKTSLRKIKQELEEAGELGQSAIAGIIKGLHESYAYRSNYSAIE